MTVEISSLEYDTFSEELCLTQVGIASRMHKQYPGEYVSVDILKKGLEYAPKVEGVALTALKNKGLSLETLKKPMWLKLEGKHQADYVLYLP